MTLLSASWLRCFWLPLVIYGVVFIRCVAVGARSRVRMVLGADHREVRQPIFRYGIGPYSPGWEWESEPRQCRPD